MILSLKSEGGDEKDETNKFLRGTTLSRGKKYCKDGISLLFRSIAQNDRSADIFLILSWLCSRGKIKFLFLFPSSLFRNFSKIIFQINIPQSRHVSFHLFYFLRAFILEEITKDCTRKILMFSLKAVQSLA